MASLIADTGSESHAHSVMANPTANSTVLSGEYRMTTGITGLCVTRTFSNMRHLANDVQAVEQALEASQNQGNQWVLVLGLTKSARNTLENDTRCLGVTFRFEWEGATGLIKVVPGSPHETATGHITATVTRMLDRMGTPEMDAIWGRATAYRPTVGNKGKEADEAFLPGSHQPIHGQIGGWPTFVVETGVSESLPKLREDCKWWFNNSGGRVRIVLLVVIRRSKMILEKWQLLPANAPNPVTRQYLAGLRQQNPNIPPLTTQPAATQQLYAAQEVTVTLTGVTGGPIILPFRALLDRAPGPNETDVTISDQTLLNLATMVI